MKGNLLRVVRSQLARRAASAVSEHPDANLLAAFAEKTLGARERNAVTNHLVHCTDCREMLALAFGSDEEPAIGAPAHPPRRWSPVWSWAASAAAICIVCSAVWEFRLQHAAIAEPPPPPPPAVTPVSSSGSPAPPPKPVASPKVALASPRPFTPPSEKKDAAPARLAGTVSPPPPPPTLATSPPAANVPAIVAAKPAPPPPYVSQDKQAVALETASQAFHPAQVQAQQSAPAGASVGASGSYGMYRSGVAGTRAVHARKAAPANVVSDATQLLWTIATDSAAAGPPRGIVQRSSDYGATWQTIGIDDHVSFRAIASRGPDIWAGGDAGMLFHSTDSGAHWQHVPFPTTIPITSIRIGDDGKLYVTAGQIWITADGGNGWIAG